MDSGRKSTNERLITRNDRRSSKIAGGAKFQGLWDRIYRFYLLPEEPILARWEYFMVLIHVVNGLSVPFMAAFRYLYTESFVGQYVTDVVFLLDMFIRFHISFLDRGFYVVFPKEMALRYLKSWEFAFDVFANTPFDLIALAWVKDPNVMYYLSIIRLHKVLRTLKLLLWFRKEESRLNAKAALQIFKFVIYITIITHWCACIWFVLACPDECLLISWASMANNVDQNNRLAMYLYSLYWTVMTMTTTGYGDIHAENDSERIWSIICMITGVFLYGYVTGTIASSLSNMDSRRVSYRQKVEAIQQYMVDQNIDRNIQKRVTDWYEYTWERNQGIDVANVFNDLPSLFRAEVAMSLNADFINKIPIFKNTSIGFRRMLSMTMKINFFTSDSYLIYRGDIGREMFFIVNGRVDILSQDEKQVTSSIVDAGYFGEYSLILNHLCEASAIAACNSDIYVLSKDDYSLVCSNYPEDANYVQETTREEYKKVQLKRKRSTRRAKGEESDTESIDSQISSFQHSRRPSFGYFVINETDKARIDTISRKKGRSPVNSISIPERIKHLPWSPNESGSTGTQSSKSPLPSLTNISSSQSRIRELPQVNSCTRVNGEKGSRPSLTTTQSSVNSIVVGGVDGPAGGHDGGKLHVSTPLNMVSSSPSSRMGSQNLPQPPHHKSHPTLEFLSPNDSM